MKIKRPFADVQYRALKRELYTNLFELISGFKIRRQLLPEEPDSI